MKRILLVLLCAAAVHLGLITSAHAAGSVVREDLGKYFEGFTGTFVMYDENNDQYIVFNESQSKKRLSPGSTFKIYHSLIGLETGVLDKDDAATLATWNGTQTAFPAWNHDHTLASATRDSAIWYFQKLAHQIGAKRMQAYLDKIKYGNRDISGGLTTFWLTSSLKISAQEQVALLHKLYSGNLPISRENVEIVKKNITLSEDNDVRFMGKTGSAFQNNKWLLGQTDKFVTGWFVGCVETQGNRYFFATNIQAQDGATGGKAKAITQTILKDIGIKLE